jgi:methylated-DNA-protein-cysteine methyltransferase-like protein
MSFRTQVYNAVNQIPYGQVATYGQIAVMVGRPRASRQVGYALRALSVNEGKVPWWRVVNAKGHISINQGANGIEKQIQADLLRDEGIEIGEDLNLNLAKYRWYPLPNIR